MKQQGLLNFYNEVSKNMRSLLIACIITVLAFSTIGCIAQNAEGSDNSLRFKNMELQELVYKKGQSSPNRIYLKENDEMAPYIILTADYNDNCLLLREFLLNERMRFNPNDRFSAYYEDSEIDRYLNGDFLSALSNEIKDKIINTEITITAKDSLGVCGTETITIMRNIFLLSYAELGGIKSSTNAAEGKPFNFFKNNESRIARRSSGEIDSWWLRTPNTWYDNVVCGVSIDGVVGIGGMGAEDEYLNGIRPAFCLPKDTLVHKEEINGNKIYLVTR